MAAHKPKFGEIGNMDDLVGLYVDTLQAWIDILPQRRDDADPTPGSQQEILLLLARAQAAWLTSGLRYGRQISELMSASGMDLAGMAALKGGGTSDQTLQQLALIDKARSFLVQVADASLSEAEALRSQLLEIEAALRDVQDSGPEEDPRRNVRTKR